MKPTDITQPPADPGTFIGEPPRILGRRTNPLSPGIMHLLTAVESPFAGAVKMDALADAEKTVATFVALYLFTAPLEELMAAARLIQPNSDDTAALREHLRERAHALMFTLEVASLERLGDDLNGYMRSQQPPQLSITEPPRRGKG